MPVFAALLLALGPFAGSAADDAQRTKFMVDVVGKPAQTVRLRAVGVPPGYVASFCTQRICAPFRISITLPASGRQSIELALIENVRGARRPTVVTVEAPGARPASIAFARGTR